MVQTGLSWNSFQSQLRAETLDCRSPRSIRSRRFARSASPRRPAVHVMSTSFTVSRPTSPSRSTSPALSPRFLAPAHARNTVSFIWLPPSPQSQTRTMRCASADALSPWHCAKSPRLQSPRLQFERRSLHVDCASPRVGGRSPAPFKTPPHFEGRSASPSPSLFDRRSTMEAATISCSPCSSPCAAGRSTSPFVRSRIEGRSPSPPLFERHRTTKAETVSYMPGPPVKHATVPGFSWTPCPVSEARPHSPRTWNEVPEISTSSIPPSPAYSFRSFKFGTSASVGSSSTATPSLTSPRLSGSSTPIMPSTSMSVGSSFVTSAAEEVTFEEPSEARFLPARVLDPAIFVSRIVDRIIGTGICSGQPGTVTRLVDAETGEKETLVIDEHGRTNTFSQETVSSVMKGAFRAARVLPKNPLLRSSVKQHNLTRDEHGRIKAIGDESIEDFFDEAVMYRWMGSLSKCNLKGFDQELRFHLSDIWTEYSKVKEEHEDHLENADYIFFGLTRDATLKDLEKAFRKLAKLMHPDKNGGSDEAKARFQDLKDRYEKLKKKILSKQGKIPNSEDGERRELLDEGQEYQDDQAEDGQSDDSKSDAAGSGAKSEDLDRDAMEKKIWELVDTAKLMQRQMRTWREQLKKVVEAK